MMTENEYYQQIIKIQNEIKSKCKNFNFKNLKFKKIENTLYLDNNSLILNLQKLNFPNITIEIQYNIFLIWNFILTIISDFGKEKFKESKFYNINQSFSNILLTVDGLILPKIISLNFQNILINNDLSIKNIFNINWAKTSFKKDNIQLKIEIKPSEFYNHIFTIKYNNTQNSFTLINLYQYICFYYYLIKQLHSLYTDINEIHIFNNIFNLSQKHSDSLTNSDLTWKLSILQKESNKMNDYTNDIKEIIEQNKNINLTPREIAQKLKYKYNIQNYDIFKVYEIIKKIIFTNKYFLCEKLTQNLLKDNHFYITNLNNIKFKLQNNIEINYLYQLQNIQLFNNYYSFQHDYLLNFADYKSIFLGYEETIDYNQYMPLQKYIEQTNIVGLAKLQIINNELIVTIKNKLLYDFIQNIHLKSCIESKMYFNDAYKIYDMIIQVDNFFKNKQKQTNENQLNNNQTQQFIQNYLKESFKIPTQEQKQTNLMSQAFNNYTNFKRTAYQAISSSQIKNQHAIYNKKYIEQQLWHIYAAEFKKLDQMIKNRVIEYQIYNNKTLPCLIYKLASNDYYNFLNIVLQTLLNITFIFKKQLNKKLHTNNYDIKFIFNNQLILNNINTKLININNLYIEQNSIEQIIKLINNIIDNCKYKIDHQINNIAIQLQYENLINIPIDIIDIENDQKFNFNLLILDYISSFLYYCYEDEINQQISMPVSI